MVLVKTTIEDNLPHLSPSKYPLPHMALMTKGSRTSQHYNRYDVLHFLWHQFSMGAPLPSQLMIGTEVVLELSR